MKRFTLTLVFFFVFTALPLLSSTSLAHKLDIVEGRLTGVSYPTGRLTGVSYPTSRLTGVSYPTNRLTGVSYPTLKEACTAFSEGRLTGVSYPTNRLTGVSYPTSRLTGVSYPTARLTGVSYPTVRITDIDHIHIEEGKEDITVLDLNDKICAETRNGIEPVPTFSEWGMIITASALALIGIFFEIRKRKVLKAVS